MEDKCCFAQKELLDSAAVQQRMVPTITRFDKVFTMAIDYRTQSPHILSDFLSYHETIKAHSQRTVDEYFLDLRNFFRYIKQLRDLKLREVPFEQIDIIDVDLELIRTITLSDIYGYMTYLSRDRVQHANCESSNKGLNAASRARKLATIRSFFNYLCNKIHVLEENPWSEAEGLAFRGELYC